MTHVSLMTAFFASFDIMHRVRNVLCITIHTSLLDGATPVQHHYGCLRQRSAKCCKTHARRRADVAYFAFMRTRGPHWSRPFGLPRESNWRGSGSDPASFRGRSRGKFQSELNRGRRSEDDDE